MLQSERTKWASIAGSTRRSNPGSTPRPGAAARLPSTARSACDWARLVCNTVMLAYEQLAAEAIWSAATAG